MSKAAASSSSIAEKKSTTTTTTKTKHLPFRSGGQPRCGHYPCTWKAQSILRKLKEEAAEADPTSIRPIALNSNNWAGPAGVATIFFKQINIPSSHPVVTTGFARVPSLSVFNIDPQQQQQQQSPIPAVSSTVPALAVLVGFDKHRNKWSICSGTMQDSWTKDQGCAADAALRESFEEFKFSFKNKQELLDLSKTHWWWVANTVCFGVNLNDLPQDDPRTDIEFMKRQIEAALRSNSTPMCEREILNLSWFVILNPASNDFGTNPRKKSKVEMNGGMTSFGIICVENLRKKLYGVATAASKPEEAVKQERESTPDK